MGHAMMRMVAFFTIFCFLSLSLAVGTEDTSSNTVEKFVEKHTVGHDVLSMKWVNNVIGLSSFLETAYSNKLGSSGISGGQIALIVVAAIALACCVGCCGI